ncbi:MAG: glycoside hydrolase domain-containing protein, partial [Huintestinicola sp.]
LGISDEYKLPTEQARMLGAYVLITAYRYGVKMDVHRMLRVIEKDVFAPNKTDFTVDGRCKSYTWMLDMADGCALACEVAKEVGETEIYERLYPLSKQWESCFSEKTGLLKEDSAYYEGTLYNYSFRQMVDMERRIEIAGGRESFIKLLDKFFGYGTEDTVQPTDPLDYAPVAAGIKLGRFEGFNNESDTETPFSYIYAGRQDRTCEIIRYGMKYMFTTGRGGLPGNNDTGALSSYYVFAALGIFPVAGQNLFLIGSPLVDGAEISLANSAVLKIEVSNNSDKNIYVKSVKFNGDELAGFRISADELLKGGTLEFEMSDSAEK